MPYQHTWLQHKYCYKCEQNSGLCKYIDQNKMFTSFSTDQSFSLKLFIKCNSTHVVYLISCTYCKVQYIGCTSRNMKIRLGEHIGAAERTLETTCTISSASRHFRDVHLEDLSSLKVNPPPHTLGQYRTKMHNFDTDKDSSCAHRTMQCALPSVVCRI